MLKVTLIFSKGQSSLSGGAGSFQVDSLLPGGAGSFQVEAIHPGRPGSRQL
jgi:hypothetical protein